MTNLKYCKDCVHCPWESLPFVGHTVDKGGKCLCMKSGVRSDPETDLVFGPTITYQTCEDYRKDGSPCGPDATLFESRAVRDEIAKRRQDDFDRRVKEELLKDYAPAPKKSLLERIFN